MENSGKKREKGLTTQDVVVIIYREYNILWQGTPSIIQPKKVRLK